LTSASAAKRNIEETSVNYTVLNRDELPRDGSTYEFEGFLHADTDLSIIWVDMPPGDGVRLHQHPYKEVFIVQEGTSTFTVGSTTLEAHAGQIVIAPADVPHKFVNSGEGRLRQIDIHLNKQFITQWLEE
jgi:mannose-6-phosphate isomerase-like protein (cupin superfamily)